MLLFCPDQLAPPVARVIGDGYALVVHPTLGPPELVDWVGYEERNEAVADNEIADDERVPLVRPLEPLTEASALLLVSSTSRDTDDVLAGFVDTDSSELYREPALRRSMRMSFGPQDLRDYGTWRQV